MSRSHSAHTSPSTLGWTAELIRRLSSASRFEVTLTDLEIAASMATDSELIRTGLHEYDLRQEMLVKSTRGFELTGYVASAPGLELDDDDPEFEMGDCFVRTPVKVVVEFSDEICLSGPYPAECWLNAEGSPGERHTPRMDFLVFDPDSWARRQIELAFERALAARLTMVSMRFILTEAGAWSTEDMSWQALGNKRVPIEKVVLWPSIALGTPGRL